MPLIGFLLMLHETILFSVGKIAVITKRFINTTIVLFFLFQISNYIPAFDNPISFNRSGILESPNNAYLNLTYGVSLSDSNKINEAIPYFRKAFELDTSTKNVRLYLARYDLIPNKKYDSAKILLLQEVQKTPNNSDNYYALSTIGYETKDLIFCEKYLEKYIQLRPDNIPIQQFAVSIYAQNHHFEKANNLAHHLKQNNYSVDEKLYQIIQDSLQLINLKKDK
jgi:tetratricopeptide (TPR) repeat protein